MSWSVVQSAALASPGPASSQAITYTSNVSSGTKLICLASADGQTGVLPNQIASVKDAALNSWTLIGRAQKLNGGGTFYLEDLSLWALDTPSGDVGTKPTLTATMSNGTSDISMWVGEVSGLAVGNTLAAMVDGTAGTSSGNGSSGSTTSPTYSSGASNEFLVAAYGDDGGPLTWTGPSGYTLDSNNVNTNGSANVAFAYKNSTNGAESSTWAITGSAADWGNILVAFKLAAGAVTLPVAQVNVRAYPFTLGSSTMAGPPFLGAYAPSTGNWTTPTSPKTQLVTANAGDVVLLFGATEDITTTLGTPSDGSNGYTLLASQTSTAHTCGGYAWATIVGAPPPLSVTTPSLSNATLGVAYTQTLTAQGGSGAGYTWAITAGALPSWASLNSATGVISGTPNATGTSNFTVRVTDSASSTAAKALSIATGSASTAPVGPPGNWTLVFEDQFPGTSLNTNYWTAVAGANNSATVTDPTKVSVSGGYCNILHSGMINSQPTLQGWASSNPSQGPTLAVGNCVEAYINFPGPNTDATYNWPAWWASGPNWPQAGEEDIFEGYDGVPSALNYHSPSGSNNGPHPSGSWCNSFHTYTLVRGSGTNGLRAYWDGVLVRQVTPNDNGGLQSLIVFNAGDGNSGGPLNTTLPIKVKYVRMWTPG